jgi:hypothetical protein
MEHRDPFPAEHRSEQAWKTLLQIVTPQRGETVSAFVAGARYAGVAQHSEMMREILLGRVEPERAAGSLACRIAREDANYFQARRVRECAQDCQDVQFLALGVY